MAPTRTDTTPTMQAKVESDHEDVDPAGDSTLRENPSPAPSARVTDPPAKKKGKTGTGDPASAAKPHLDSPLISPYPRKCNECKKVEPSLGDYKPCPGCKMVQYCSRECKKADFKKHKKECVELDKKRKAAETAVAEAVVQTHNESAARIQPQQRARVKEIISQKWIDVLSDKEWMERCIDAFRLSVEDECKKKKSRRGVHGVENPQLAFKKFLNGLEKCDKEWAPWLWKNGGRKACEQLANRISGWSSIHRQITEDEIKEHYGDIEHPALLRLLAKIAWGEEELLG